jgi:hypothetical protein
MHPLSTDSKRLHPLSTNWKTFSATSILGH